METGFIKYQGQAIGYSIRRSAKRRKSIAARWQGLELVVLAPLRASKSAIEGMLHRHAAPLLKKRPNPAAMPDLPQSERLLYLGQKLRLEIGQGRGAVLEDNLLRLSLSPNPSPQHVDAMLKLWYKKQARRVLKIRLDGWALHMKLPYARFALTNARARWGSCSSQNSIRLNWRLVMVEEALIDYVAVHELAHVVHKNHAPAFWQLVEATMPDHKARRKKLHALSHLLATF